MENGTEITNVTPEIGEGVAEVNTQETITTEGTPGETGDSFDPTEVLEGTTTTGETPEGEVVEPGAEPEEKQPTEFDPEEIDFEEEKPEGDAKFQFEDYNLEKFKDILDFDSDENREIIGSKLKELKDAGYSQEKVEGYVEALLELEKDKTPEPVSAEQVKQELSANLTKEAKSNYRAIGAWFRDSVKGTEFEGKDFKDAMSNPRLVNVLNHLYKNYVANQGVKTREVPNPQPKVTMDYMGAMQGIQDKLTKGIVGEELTTYAKELLPKLSGEDLEQFKRSAKNVLKLDI